MADLALIDTKTGNLVNLKTRDLTAYQLQMSNYPAGFKDASGQALICAAAVGGHAEVLDWVLNERFPNYSPFLQSHLAAIGGGVPVYDIFVKKYPYLINYDLGHNGNPIGNSIFRNDKAMVQYLLSKGVDPNTAHFSGRPFNQLAILFKHVQPDIIDLLIKHGFSTPADDSEDDPDPMKAQSSKCDRGNRCTVI